MTRSTRVKTCHSVGFSETTGTLFHTTHFFFFTLSVNLPIITSINLLVYKMEKK